MRIWLDTEFNSFNGELLSIGMVSESGEYFYTWFDIGLKSLDPWVAKHVYPIINKSLTDDGVFEPEDVLSARHRLSNYLLSMSKLSIAHKEVGLEIIADWPEDVYHLNKFMLTGGGTMIDTPNIIRYTVDRTLNGESALPHHALYDAFGNMEQQLTREAELASGRFEG